MVLKFESFRVLLHLEPSLSMRQIFVVRGGLPMDPITTLQDINAWTGPARPWTMAKIPKIIILGYGKGDSCQISPIKKTSTICFRAAPSIY